MRTNFCLLLILFLVPSHALGVDFYLVVNECKTVVGFTTMANVDMKVYDSTKYIASCTRSEGKVKCDFFFEDKAKSNKMTYNVIIETPPLLHLESDNGAEYIAIHQTNRSVTALSRAVGEEFLAGKLCQGLYATKYEFDALMEKQGQKVR